MKRRKLLGSLLAFVGCSTLSVFTMMLVLGAVGTDLTSILGLQPFSTVSSAEAQDASQSSGGYTPSITPPASEEELMKGVWNEGKAVFSDVPLLDIFTKYAKGYNPAQPINYSHYIHVEKNKMECTYCHSGVNKSHFATIPSVESCMGCHKLVKTESPEIKKLKDYYDKKIPVEWEPVNNLPEHAHFNHERHVKAGVGCQTCHGQVNKMAAAQKVSTLKMGWCVSCHRDRGVTIDCAVCHY